MAFYLRGLQYEGAGFFLAPVAWAGADETAPEFTASPSITATGSTTATVAYQSNEAGTGAVVVTAYAASQPDDATFDAAAEAITTAAVSKNVTGLTAATLLKAWVQIKDSAGNRATSSVALLTSHTGYSRVTIGTPDATAADRLTAVADLASGDVIDYGDVVGTGTVVVNSSGTFNATATVTGFDYYVGNLTDGWGTSATQTIQEPIPVETDPPTVIEATILAVGNQLRLTANEAVKIGAGGSGGVTLSLSGGACTATYASGGGTAELVFNLSRYVNKVETGTVGYTQPGNGIEDVGGSNDLASFSGFAILNGSSYSETPTDILLSKSTVSTTAGLNAIVGTFSATDPEGDSCTFSLVSGTGDTDNGSFLITGNALTCNDPETLGEGTYSIRVQAYDGYSSRTEVFSITVNTEVASRENLTTWIMAQATGEITVPDMWRKYFDLAGIPAGSWNDRAYIWLTAYQGALPDKIKEWQEDV